MIIHTEHYNGNRKMRTEAL